MKILITGGAGFIGSHLADQLISAGHQVRSLDSLDPQVHGDNAKRPDYLHPNVELIVGEVQQRWALDRALDGVDAVFHLAAKVGVGQSMYLAESYIDTNVIGTARLMEALAMRRGQVKRLVVASSMSVYGEGSELIGELISTPEWSPPEPQSVYALTKYDQERLCLMLGKAYGIPTVALRFFNTYGPRQSLRNPYTGVLAIFAARLLIGQPPLIYDDGQQTRDFVHVSDVARACVLAMESGGDEVINVGTGVATSVMRVAQMLAEEMGVDIEPELTGEIRRGDIRHCFADVSKAERLLGYRAQMSLRDGIADLVRSAKAEDADDRTGKARYELRERGLLDAGHIDAASGHCLGLGNRIKLTG